MPNVQILDATTHDTVVLAIVATAVGLYLEEARAARPPQPVSRWVKAARSEACGITVSRAGLADRWRSVR